jgi:hypothetical protein
MHLRQVTALFLSICVLVSCEKNNNKPDTETDTRLSDGLLAYYTFNGNANDHSGKGNHGTLTNGASLSYDENGRAMSALNITGNGQRVVVPSSEKMALDTAMTISFHAMQRTSKRANIVGMTNDATGKGTSFVIGPALPGNSNLIYSVANDEVSCDVTVTSDMVSNIDAGFTMQPESWYHVLCIYNRGKMKLFINGSLISTRQSQDNLMHTCTGGSNLLIGGWWSQDPDANFSGKVDEVRLYNRELNEDEIAELAKSFR